MCAFLISKTGKCKKIWSLCVTKQNRNCGYSFTSKWPKKFVVLEKEYVLNNKNQLYTALKKSTSRRKLYIYVSAKEYGFFEGKARPQMPEVNPILLPDLCTCEVRPQNKSRQEGKVCVCVLWRVNSRTASVNLVALNSNTYGSNLALSGTTLPNCI